MLLKGRDDIRIDPHSSITWIGLFTSKICNMCCLYCYEGSGEPDHAELTGPEKTSLIKEAKELGAKVLVIPGAGEPLMDKSLFSLIVKAHSLKMTTILYTNGTLINKDIAQFFFHHNVTVLVKIESLDANTHNHLTGRVWSHKKAMDGLDCLLSSGYGNTNSRFHRIGVASLYTKLNITHLSDLKRWCSDRNIAFMVDWLSISQRAKIHEIELKPSRQEIQHCTSTILGIRESGCDREGGNCILWHHGINIDQQGYARPCTEVRTKQLGNCREHDLTTLIDNKNKVYPPQGGKWTCYFKDRYYI